VLPWVWLLVVLQNRVWPPSGEAAEAMERLFRAPLEQQPLLTALSVGLLAGICEELLYRGPVQSALVRRLPERSALLIGAVLFAAAHLDPHGILPRAVLGYLLGWIVLRSGSVFPAMLAHAAIDSTSLALSVWAPKGSPLDPELAGRLTLSVPWLIQLGAGAAMAAAGYALCRAQPPPEKSVDM
jgi:uncharacterized protein